MKFMLRTELRLIPDRQNLQFARVPQNSVNFTK